MKNLGNIMKQAQEMQSRMAKMQEELAAMQVSGQSGGGMVEVTLDGKQMMKRIKIDRSIVDPQDVELLEDLITAAFNDAQKKLLDLTQQNLSKVTGGLNIPGLNLPF
ncbi:YbaB/EbfC family nucleoid-associated protein [Candidatus Magnetaquicoccus inordinatus]|uniref:YbaB/EbfC family nucleoid-associated protein n=1 Tax=Candidatus Magnetaquicoccus inordinatus TaxID=2496818 RepID=UPI00102CC1E6|nr:YbaB/EbfC family nucleoid-associated protein [Candidatus Magnetaquicoccus inordinatus]